MRLRLEVRGATDLAGRLETLGRRERVNVVRRGLRRGLAVWRRELARRIIGLDLDAEAKARMRRGLRVRVVRSRDLIYGRVLMRRSEDGMPIWRWVDQGTEERYRELDWELDVVRVQRRGFVDPRSRAGKARRSTSYDVIVRRATRRAYTGRIKPQPFIRPALEAGAQEVLETLDREIRAEIAKTWQRSR